MTANLEGAVWRKSSRSGNTGGQCVEVACTWRKSSRSGGNGGACVEVACFGGVRDSKNQDGPALAFGHAELTAFLSAAKHGRFDR